LLSVKGPGAVMAGPYRKGCMARTEQQQAAYREKRRAEREAARILGLIIMARIEPILNIHGWMTMKRRIRYVGKVAK
jgi:hypothetical protein